MDTHTDITPALTAAEWADVARERCFDRRDEVADVRLGYSHMLPDGLYVESYWDRDGASYNAIAHVPAEHRAALAALALHGQPYGFTRRDVTLLRALAAFDDHGYRVDLIADLADRIAALLPPE